MMGEVSMTEFRRNLMGGLIHIPVSGLAHSIDSEHGSDYAEDKYLCRCETMASFLLNLTLDVAKKLVESGKIYHHRKKEQF